MKTAPIALFVYNRPLHTRRTVEALQRNRFASASDLYIFSDGPRTPDSLPAVGAVREYIRGVTGFRTVSIHERPQNVGLANSIIAGVTQLCGSSGRVIVLEDDLVTCGHFLQFMNEALELYESCDSVASIHGYWYPVTGRLPETFFLKIPSSWGWATWSRAWQLFEPDGRKLLAELHRRRLAKTFDFDGAMPYTRILEHQIAGKSDSWAIRWDAAVFLAGKLSLYPGTSLVKNIGFDGTGRHSGISAAFDVDLPAEPIGVAPVPIMESAEARAALIEYYRAKNSGLLPRLANRLRHLGFRAVRSSGGAK